MGGILYKNTHPNFDALSDIGRINLENPCEMQKRKKEGRKGRRKEKRQKQRSYSSPLLPKL